MKKLAIIKDIFILLLVIGIFAVSIFTVINLTPTYNSNTSGPSVLGTYTNTNGLVIAKSSINEGVVKNLQINYENDNCYINSSIQKLDKGMYYSPLVGIENQNIVDFIVSVNLEKNEFPANTRIYLIVDGQNYEIDPSNNKKLPYLKINVDTKVEVGLVIEARENINFINDIVFRVSKI